MPVQRHRVDDELALGRQILKARLVIGRELIEQMLQIFLDPRAFPSRQNALQTGPGYAASRL